MPSDIPGNRQHITQIRGAVFTRRCANGDENVFRYSYSRGHVTRERQQPALHRLFHQRLQARFVDGDVTRLQSRKLALVVVDTGHMVAHLGKAGPRDQTYVSRSDDSDAHA